MVRKIVARVAEETLLADLERYRLRAIELGATDARIIPVSSVLIDERVRAKCIYPKCRFYGTNGQCPPYSMEPSQTKRVIESFKYGVFIMIWTPAKDLLGKDESQRKPLRLLQLKMHEIVSRIEGEAFRDGYHLALGFAGGPCKPVFCPETECSLLTPGQGCRHPLRARSSMEAVGMNAYTMAAEAGWDIYPLGPSVQADEVPNGTRLGIVMIH